jgi:uncharacterized protein YndB with AHSA1/START domain
MLKQVRDRALQAHGFLSEAVKLISMPAPLHAEKTYTVSAARLYRAWTTPEELMRWWHPGTSRLVSVTNELQEGGTVKYDFNNDKGYAFSISGTYQEVVPEKRLVYTWNWQIPEDSVGEGEHKLSVEFVDEGAGNTTLRVTQESLNDQEAIHPHHFGWDEGLEALRVHLADATAVS